MLTLELYTEADRSLYEQLVFNEQVMGRNLGRVFTAEEAALFFGALLDCNRAGKGLGFYKVLRGGEFIGLGAMTANDAEKAIEIEYMLLPQYWNRGHGTELVRHLLAQIDRTQGRRDVIAITDPANRYSQRILTHAGFAKVRQFCNADGEPAILYRRPAAPAKAVNP